MKFNTVNKEDVERAIKMLESQGIYKQNTEFVRNYNDEIIWFSYIESYKVTAMMSFN